MTSFERVSALLKGDLPDRPPLYDVIRNDAVIEHFCGEKLNPESAQSLIARAHSRGLDGTKSFFKLPHFAPGGMGIDQRGRRTTYKRWTTWTEHAVYPDTETYIKEKSERTTAPWDWNTEDQQMLDAAISNWRDIQRESGDLCRSFNIPGPPRLDSVFTEVGLEAFSYYMADCPGILHRQIEYHFAKVTQAIEAADLPEDVLFIGEGCDIAFKTGLLFPPKFLKRSFLPGLAGFCRAAHEKGLPVQFHSDGNLMAILDDLVEAGIDLLHPIEPLAGMDAGVIHKRYPELILQGSIDVSQLLPFGTEQEVEDAVKRNIDATEGNIMIGSSTELNDEVPLKNFLALRRAVLAFKLGH